MTTKKTPTKRVAKPKPSFPPKFLTVAIYSGGGRSLSIVAQAETQEAATQKGLTEMDRYRGYQAGALVYQLVAVSKPKPIEYDTVTLAVCKPTEG